MADIEAAMANKDEDGMRAAMSDHWLSENTLFGPAAKVREGVEAWLDTGVRPPILVPSSANGNQIKALEELFRSEARSVGKAWVRKCRSRWAQYNKNKKT